MDRKQSALFNAFFRKPNASSESDDDHSGVSDAGDEDNSASLDFSAVKQELSASIGLRNSMTQVTKCSIKEKFASDPDAFFGDKKADLCYDYSIAPSNELEQGLKKLSQKKKTKENNGCVRKNEMASTEDLRNQVDRQCGNNRNRQPHSSQLILQSILQHPVSYTHLTLPTNREV